MRPGRDDKVLTGWNALAIDGMAFAARVFGQPRWAESARRALDFVRSALWRDGRLLATHKDGRSHLNAYLDDHAFLLGAVLELMQGDVLLVADLEFARALADLMLEQFEDPHEGGFFFTSHDHEALVLRPKSGHDGSAASGNGMAALHLQRLGHLVGEPRYLAAAQRTMSLFAAEVGRTPHGFGTLVSAMAEYRSPPTVVMLTGPRRPPHAGARSLIAVICRACCCCNCPRTPPGCPTCWPSRVVLGPKPGSAAAPQCLPAISDIEPLLALLSEYEADI